MGLIREPLDVDFYVDPRPLTEEEERLLSEYFRHRKLQSAKSATATVRKNVTRPIALQKKKQLA